MFPGICAVLLRRPTNTNSIYEPRSLHLPYMLHYIYTEPRQFQFHMESYYFSVPVTSHLDSRMRSQDHDTIVKDRL